MAARGSRSADLFKPSSSAPDAAALSKHLEKLNQLEEKGGGARAGGAGGQGEGEGDDEPVDVVQDEDDDDVMEEDDYYQVG